MADQVQSYKRHARWLPAYHFFVMPVLLANVVNAIRRTGLVSGTKTLIVMSTWDRATSK